MTGTIQGVEIELKLAISNETLDRLADSELLRDRAGSPAQTHDLHAIYYDTPDGRLRDRGLSLRVRAVDGRYVQTLKGAADAVGQLGRPEYEVERDGPTPDLRAFDDAAVLDRVGLVSPDELVSVFETRVRRRVVTLAWTEGAAPPSLIEVALDRGSVRANGRDAPINELELELKAGEAAALYELVTALRRVAPLRIEPLSKSDRGWLLAAERSPDFRKADAPVLDDGMTVGQGMAAVFGSCFAQWLANEPAARDGRTIEGLHQLRVGLRRLRSALSLFAPVLAPEARRHWDEELRSVLGELNLARDLDVMATGTLPKVQAANEGDDALAAFATALSTRRETARARAGDFLASQRYADITLAFAGWLAREGWREGADAELRDRQDEPLVELAADLLVKRHKVVRKRGRGMAELDPPSRHKVRIALKKLRYGVEFFTSLFPAKRAERFADAVADLQDELGHLNDAATTRAMVNLVVDGAGSARERVPVALGGGQLIGWQAAAVAADLGGVLDDWKAFQGLKPFWRGKGRA